ncbi:MAG: (Fe-S)-binding protein [Deltaproteobacteria bacterium]|nr:(Fe-S)-binding protein [Deltaproteobacteria bacterium]
MGRGGIERDSEGLCGERFMEGLREVVLDAASRCRSCNSCFTVCPVFESTKGFMSQTPSGIMQSITYAIKWNLFGPEEKETLRDLLYLCTTCNACVLRCKSKSSGVPVLDAIEAGRKILREMMIGPLPAQRKPMKDIYGRGNPYGEGPEGRLDWLGDLEVKRLPREKAAVLYYVGCTTAYEPDLHMLGRSLIRLFQYSGIDFGVLESETCCGEPARRMGDEALFQELAEQNTNRFREAGVKTIITTSPHCFSVFANEYPSLKGEFETQHYTQFLASLFEEKKPTFKKEFHRTVAYHDPCYLGKHNQIFDPPRELLEMVPGVELVEMRMTRDESLCCGGGGARMFAEVEEERRLSDMRVGQALEMGADVLATACPWCHTMLHTSVQNLGLMDKIKVMDVAEILDESLR